MNGRTENAFLAELIRAMEADGSDIPSIEDVQNGQLGSEDMGRDPSGNPEGPGDDGDPTPNWGAEPSDNPHDVIDANDPSGNPDGPGDENGDPKDPATEAFSGAVEVSIWQRGANSAIAKAMTDEQLCHTFMKVVCDDRRSRFFVPVFDGAVQAANDYIRAYKEIVEPTYGPDGDDLNLKVITESGRAGVWCDDGRGNFLDLTIMNAPFNPKKKTGINVNRNSMIHELRKYDMETEMNPGAVESESISVDENDVPEGSFDDFLKNVNVANNTNLIELSGEKKPRTDDGTADDPGANADPSLQRGSPKPAPEEPQTAKGNDPSGNPDDPGVNGTPVLKGGSPAPLAKTEAERAADDPTGNPDSPGVDAKPDLGFESFIATCERSMISKSDGTIFIPQGMTLESYAMEIGLGEIVARALEADLTQAEKDKLPASAFGLPKERKWPLNDENHVRQAIRYFGRCPQEQQRELAKNILKAKRKFGMTDMKVGKNNPYRKYDPDLQVADAKPAKGKK